MTTLDGDEPATRREIELRWAAHDREHVALQLAVNTADAEAKTALRAALTDHHREHGVHDTFHDREHDSTEQSIAKSEAATDKRFEGANAFREQLREQAVRLAGKDQLEALAKDTDRRFEETRSERERRLAELRLAVTNLEKGDVRVEGRELGRSAMVAIIVTAIGLVGTILGILVVAANALTTT